MIRMRAVPAFASLAAVAALLTTLVPPALASASPGNAGPASFVPLKGDGSSWAENAITQWARDMEPQGIHISYPGNGSASGRSEYQLNQLDFAGSDIAYLTRQDPDPFGGGNEPTPWAYSYIPIVAGGTVFMYNLVVGGHKVTNLRLSGDTITKIFTGQITNWADPRITHDYGAQLPSEPITWVTRSDGSGASYQFSRWMWKVYTPQWEQFCHASGGPASCGPTEFYPGGHSGEIQRNGSLQIANYISSYPGSIGYDEYSYAIFNSIPAVKLLNPGGYYVLPTASNVAIALQKAQIDQNPNDVTFLMQNLDSVYTYNDPRSYPLSSYSYLVVPRLHRKMPGNQGNVGPPTEFNNAKGATLTTWMKYVLCGAQQTAGNLGYSPLPYPLVTGGFLEFNQIPGHISSIPDSQLNNCNNPTYHNGVNYLIKYAPYPNACDKLGASLTCNPNHPGSGNNNGPGGNNGNHNNGHGGTGNQPGSGGTNGPGQGQINPNTGQQLAGGGGTSPAYAQSVSLTGNQTTRWFFIMLAAFSLIAAITVPTFLGEWLRRRRKAAP